MGLHRAPSSPSRTRVLISWQSERRLSPIFPSNAGRRPENDSIYLFSSFI
jgi:hypothetical protein